MDLTLLSLSIKVFDFDLSFLSLSPSLYLFPTSLSHLSLNVRSKLPPFLSLNVSPNTYTLSTLPLHIHSLLKTSSHTLSISTAVSVDCTKSPSLCMC